MNFLLWPGSVEEHVRANSYNTSNRLSDMDSSTDDTEHAEYRSTKLGSESPAESRESSTAEHAVVADSTYSRAQFIEPSSLGYIHIGATVRPRSLPLTLLPNGREKTELLTRLKERARHLEELEAVETAAIFETAAMPPLHRLPYIKEHKDSIHLARFDVAVLIETKSPVAAREVQDTQAYQSLMDAIQNAATDVHVMAARNEKRIGDVDKTKQGVFIFNYFVADDPDVMLELFDYLAGGYVAETGLDNSTLLVPLDNENADYIAINNARWDIGILRFLWRELTNKSLRSFVQTNLKANQVGAMPVLYRLA
ncbi:hypothetical protein [Haladaptatus halobius]|uniref:hypothetical protein n=1 Tax=Haladaptatus halobius TaxID=2884875 RepID=UPI001D09ECF2|nr:hypothetical protein [Haladaptatus halobius]